MKKTKTNESTEQKTQYLETMLRMPQPKAALNASRFDRMRFADTQASTITPTTTRAEQLDDSSFHLIGDISSHEDIRTLERILFNKDFDQPQTQSRSPNEASDQQSTPTPTLSVRIPRAVPVPAQMRASFASVCYPVRGKSSNKRTMFRPGALLRFSYRQL